MPQELRIGPYTIYFWSNENEPLEPVHVFATTTQRYRNGCSESSQR